MKDNWLRQGATAPNFLPACAGRPVERRQLFNVLAGLAMAGALLATQAAARTESRKTGTVKWFSKEKGFGFIKPDKGGPDVFVHYLDVESAGLLGLREGQRVSYVIVVERGKSKASDLRIIR